MLFHRWGLLCLSSAVRYKGLGRLTPDFGLRFCEKINFGIKVRKLFLKTAFGGSGGMMTTVGTALPYPPM